MSHPYTEAAAKRTAEKQAEALRMMGVASDGSRARRADDGTHNWLRDECRDWLNAQTGVCVWNNDATPRHGTPGTSDLIGWRKVWSAETDSIEGHSFVIGADWVAQFLAIEIKRRRDKERVKQSGFLREVNAAGGIGIVVRDSVEDLKKQWRAYMEAKR